MTDHIATLRRMLDAFKQVGIEHATQDEAADELPAYIAALEFAIRAVEAEPMAWFLEKKNTAPRHYFTKDLWFYEPESDYIISNFNITPLYPRPTPPPPAHILEGERK